MSVRKNLGSGGPIRFLGAAALTFGNQERRCMPMSDDEVAANAVRVRADLGRSEADAARVFMRATIMALGLAHGEQRGALMFAAAAKAVLECRRESLGADNDLEEGNR